MMKVGIIGGMGSQAGMNLASKVLELCPGSSDQEFIEFVLHNNTRIPDRTQAIVYNGPSPVPELLRSVQLMNDAKVDLIMMACITAHYYYDQLKDHADGEFLHAISILKDLLLEDYGHCKRIGILATTGSIQSGIYHQITQGTPFELVTLDTDSQERIFMKAIYGENGLKSSGYSPEAAIDLQNAVELLISRGAEVIVGGCTEVSLALDQSLVSVPFIDMVVLLAKEAVNKCIHPVTDVQ